MSVVNVTSTSRCTRTGPETLHLQAVGTKLNEVSISALTASHLTDIHVGYDIYYRPQCIT